MPRSSLNGERAGCRQRRRREAIEHFQRAIEIDPKMLDADYHLGLALQRAGKGEEAIPLLQTWW